MLVTVLGLLLVIAVAIFVTWPLLQEQETANEEAPPSSQSDARGRLEREKVSALAAIRDADFDHRAGKLSNEDHSALRAELEGRALRVMEAIDTADASQARSTRSPPDARRQSRVEPGKAPGGVLIRSPRDEKQSRSGSELGHPLVPGKFCTACGQPIQSGTTFCAGCGKALARSPSGRGNDRHRATR